MNRLSTRTAALAVILLCGGCASAPGGNSPARSRAASPGAAAPRAAAAPVIEKVKFRVGESSTTVERLARRFGCQGSPGAGLVTKEGPVEVYRMQCDNGTTFLAECELRQCRPMR